MAPCCRYLWSFLPAGRRALPPRALRLALLWLLAAGPAAAQYYSPYVLDTTQVFSYVDQMPSLPSGGGNLALVKVVQQQLKLPPEVREGRVEGRVFVRAVVGASGVVRQPTVVQSLSPACDAAALAAVQKMPRLRPGLYQGQPVAVLLTLPVMFLSPHHVYTAAEVAQPAQFPGGDAALEQYLQQHRTVPDEVKQRDLKGRVVVRSVIKADGRMGATEVVNSLCPGCDEEALRLVRGFPRWQPARGYDGQAVAMYQNLNIWFSPPAPPAGTAPPVPANQVYSLAEQMPTLPGRTGPTAIQAALQELIQYPELAPSGNAQVSFVVEPDGRVTRPAMVQSLGRAMDEAILAAVLRLPRFEPGRQHGRPVAVQLVVPVAVEIR